MSSAGSSPFSLCSAISNWNSELICSTAENCETISASLPSGVFIWTLRVDWVIAMSLESFLTYPEAAKAPDDSTSKPSGFEWHQPQTGLFVGRVEIQAVTVLAFRDDHRNDFFEFLARNRGGGDFVDRLVLDVAGPARVCLVDTRARVRGASQYLQEFVVVVFDYLGASHIVCRPLWKGRSNSKKLLCLSIVAVLS